MVLVMLVQSVERIAVASPPDKGGIGRLCSYLDKLFIKAPAILIIKHLHTPSELLCVLAQPALEVGHLHAFIMEGEERHLTPPTW